MKSAVIVARDNAYGLSRDSTLLKDAFENSGFSVSTATPGERSLFSRLSGRRHADVVVHMERAFPKWFSAAPANYLVPNQERFPHRHVGRLKKIDCVLAKTRHAEQIFGKLGVRTHYIGFTSDDRFLPDVEKQPNRFLNFFSFWRR